MMEQIKPVKREHDVTPRSAAVPVQGLYSPVLGNKRIIDTFSAFVPRATQLHLFTLLKPSSSRAGAQPRAALATRRRQPAR